MGRGSLILRVRVPRNQLFANMGADLPDLLGSPLGGEIRHIKFRSHHEMNSVAHNNGRGLPHTRLHQLTAASGGLSAIRTKLWATAVVAKYSPCSA
jgi:hypothetical protein